MSRLFFPDNTVLINFALIARTDLLERLVDGRGAWSGAVASECARSAREPGLAAMGQAGDIFGEPWHPETGAEHVEIRTLRDRLAKPGDRPRQHLGEAETLVIIERRSPDAIFVTDDAGAALIAKVRGVPVTTTWELLKLAARVHFIDGPTTYGAGVDDPAHRDPFDD